ncbi:putative adhesin [Vagococcus sp. WN89Y]|uniref:putative adhesin n=1 Tax=Vagococcus sp. WN89Y TaxID=3457258 RepID=UPI003FCE8A98
MPEIPALHAQYRRAIGTQANRQDSTTQTQHDYDRYIKKLADMPGLHSSNAQRQALAPALLQVIACLSYARPTPQVPEFNHTTHEKSHSLVPQLFSVTRPAPLLPQPVRYRRAAPQAGVIPRAINKPVTVLDIQDAEQIIFNEQQKRIIHLLRNSHTGGIHTAEQRLNQLVNYLQTGAAEKKRDVVANRLIRTGGGYYTNKKHAIPPSWKQSAIADYMLRELLGMPFTPWLILQKDLNHGVIEKHLKTVKNLNPQTLHYFQTHILNKILPTITFSLSAADENTLNNMSLLQPEWGYLHAGALLLNESGVSLDGLTLNEIQDIGLLLDMLLRNASVPDDYAEYFRLPALLHNQFSEHKKEDNQQILPDYFSHTQAWIIDNNPLYHLHQLAKGWKTRRELAKELLIKHQVNEKWLIRWLNYHAPMPATGRNGRIVLPNIDDVFDKQNEKLTEANRRVEHLLLSDAFESLHFSDQQFILTAKVERVNGEFNSMASLYGVPLPPSARVAMSQSNAMIFRIPDNIELLKCSAGDEVRIYALEEHKESSWRFNRVDYNRQQLLDLLPDDSIPATDPDYKLKYTTPILLKQPNESTQKTILQLAQLRYTKLLKSLAHVGYEKTTQEKAHDFLLSLIPFYTCISESIKGNIDEAMPACAMDIVSFLPFAGAALATSTRFGITLSRATTLALRYGLQQAGIKQILKSTGSTIIKQFPSIAQQISPQVMRGLGNSFISAVDPGFNLLALAGEQGINALAIIMTQIPSGHLGIERLTSILHKRAQPSLRSATNLNVKSVYSQLHGKDLDVTLTATERGREIWVRVDRKTGELFGRKYIRNAFGFLEPAPVKLGKRFYQIKTMGLGGHGSKFAAEIWRHTAENRLLLPSETTNYKDFSITTYNKYLSADQKELIVLAHGRLRSRFRKIAAVPADVYFYAAANRDFEASNAEILKFQTRREDLTPQDIINTGAETRDYELQHASGPFEDTYAKFRYHSRFLNSDISAGSNNGKPLFDVLIINKEHTITLAKLIEQIPPYSKIHCLFCRTRAMP